MTVKKPLYTLLLITAALLLLLGGTALLVQRQTLRRASLDGLPTLDLPYRQTGFGVNVDLRAYEDGDALADNLDLIQHTGFTWLRQDFAWSDIEPQQGTFDWSVYDRIVEFATARDLQLVAVLGSSPEWAASAPTAPPDQLVDFANFAAILAERYGNTLQVYQVWDEPNLAAGWGDQPADPVAYAALLEAAYQAIHAADSDAFVLTAGFAPTLETGPDNLSDILFLQALYDNGAAPFFDGVAGKPYGFDTGPDDRRAHENLLNFSRFTLLRAEMERAGDTDKPLWASHFGWNSLPAGWEGQASLWGQAAPETQAAWTVEAYQRARIEWPWAGPLILDNWQPGTLSDDARWGFALRDQNGGLSPTADEIQRQLASLNDALWPGIYPVQNDIVTYSGQWEFSELGADFGEDGSSMVDLPFVGDTLAVIVRRGNYRAYLYVTVDGKPSSLLPRDERGTYLVLTSPDYEPSVEVLSIAPGDADQLHITHIEADRGWDQWALVGYAVGSRVDTTLYDVLAGLFFLAAAACGTLGLRRARNMSWRAPLDRAAGWITVRLGEASHLVLGLAAALAAWLGAALTWGGLVPELVRRFGELPSLLLTALTAGVFYFSPWLLLTLLALLLLFVLIYARPGIGLALIMFFTPYYLLPRPLFDRAFSMVEILSLLTLAAWLIRITAQRRERGWPSWRSLWRATTGLDRALGLFVLSALISLLWADLPGVALTDLRQMLLEPLIMYLVLRTLPADDGTRWRILDMLILTGVVVSLIGFYQAATGIDIITAEQGARRLRSIFGTPNNAALYLDRLIPITAAVALAGGKSKRRWLYGAATLAMLGAATLTLSRGWLLLGLPAGLGLVLILWAGRIGVIIAGAGVVLLGLSLIPLSRLPRFASLFNFSEGSSFFRLQLWDSTFQLLRDHPITGVGLDQFLYAYRGRYILPTAWQQPDLSQPHNFLLNYWVRLGLLGLAAGIWIQVAFWRMAAATLKRLKTVGSPPQRALVIGLMGSMAAFIGHGLVDETHFVIDLAFIFYMTLGFMHQLHQEASHE